MKKFRCFMQIAYSPNNALITGPCRLRGGCERLPRDSSVEMTGPRPLPDRLPPQTIRLCVTYISEEVAGELAENVDQLGPLARLHDQASGDHIIQCRPLRRAELLLLLCLPATKVCHQPRRQGEAEKNEQRMHLAIGIPCHAVEKPLVRFERPPRHVTAEPRQIAGGCQCAQHQHRQTGGNSLDCFHGVSVQIGVNTPMTASRDTGPKTRPSMLSIRAGANRKSSLAVSVRHPSQYGTGRIGATGVLLISTLVRPRRQT